MQDSLDFGTRPFHFIGIGGIGMSAIAHVLAKQGYRVTGSDLSRNRVIEQLEAIGVAVYQGQTADNIAVAEQPQVVYSSAIKPNNPELQTAIQQNLTLWHRSDLLARLINRYHSVAISGTHGKTTTSSLTAFLLLHGGLDPTIIIGGEVAAWQGNARLGASKYLVAEADESDGSFTKFYPHIGVVTNIELDHPDHYNSLDQVIGTFQQFGQNCQVLVSCWDCPNTKQYLNGQVSYSLCDPSADYTVQDVVYGGTGTHAVVVERGQVLGEIRLSLLGKHNLSNALAAIAVARYLNIAWQSISDALPQFKGAKRRFEVKGEVAGITLVDDYAHHPSEVQATLSAAKLQRRRVVAVFQPHRYSRTQALLSEFATAFASADVVVITEIYGAGEIKIANLSGQLLADKIAEHHPKVYFQPDLSSLGQFLCQLLRAGDLVVFLSAGNLNQVISPTMERLRQCWNAP
jgi:UDP-N-acetylmuramate--alanine ligase